MIRYHPIESGVKWDSSLAELRTFDWQSGIAEWDAPGEKPVIVAVQFRGQIIARILDDFALSTETNPENWEGLEKDHFAYWVEGDAFHENQSPTWLEVEGPTKHYRFLTGNGCLDVIAACPPAFSINPT